MTPSKLINKAVEEFDKLEVKSFNLKTNKYQMEQLLILDDKGRKMVKSFLTKCIQEAYEAGYHNGRAVGFRDGYNAGSIESQSLTKQSKEDK